MTRARDMHLTMPVAMPEPGPHTPVYELSKLALPSQAKTITAASAAPPTNARSAHGAAAPRQLPGGAPGLSGPTVATLPPSPSPGPAPVTGKRPREDEWAPAEVEILEGYLARPLRQSVFPPGAMPPPHVLDELTTAVLGQGPNNSGDDLDGYEASAEPSPAPSNGGSRATSPLVNTASSTMGTDSWPHSWQETRRMLAALALAETRLGHEVADRKLSRVERLAKPGVKRVGSMDFLEEEDNVPEAEKLSRAKKLSARLQNSAKEKVELQRAASLGGPVGSRAPGAGPRPFLTITPSSPSVPATALPPPPPPAPMLRVSSTRSNSSTSLRPSLLTRGRSFTASDLEAELEEASRKAVSEPVSNVTSLIALDSVPRTPTDSDSAGENDDGILEITPKNSPSKNSPRSRRASAPENPSPRLLRSHSYAATSRFERRQRDSYDHRHPLGVGRPPAPPPVHDLSQQQSLGGAFDPTVPSAPERLGGGWDSDSDREGAISVKRRATRPCLAMTAMAGAAGRGSGTGSSGSLSSMGAGAAGPGATAPSPPLASLRIEEHRQQAFALAPAQAPTLASPFHEHPPPFN